MHSNLPNLIYVCAATDVTLKNHRTNVYFALVPNTDEMSTVSMIEDQRLAFNGQEKSILGSSVIASNGAIKLNVVFLLKTTPSVLSLQISGPNLLTLRLFRPRALCSQRKWCGRSEFKWRNRFLTVANWGWQMATIWGMFVDYTCLLCVWWASYIGRLRMNGTLNGFLNGKTFLNGFVYQFIYEIIGNLKWLSGNEKKHSGNRTIDEG